MSIDWSAYSSADIIRATDIVYTAKDNAIPLNEAVARTLDMIEQVRDEERRERAGR